MAALAPVMLERLGRADEIGWGRASSDSASIAAPGGEYTGPNPSDKGKKCSERHIVVDRNGVPLAVVHTATNVHDSKVLEEAVDAIEPICRLCGWPRKRPKKLYDGPKPQPAGLQRASDKRASGRPAGNGRDLANSAAVRAL